MRPLLATLLTLGFVSFLFRSDHRETPGVTRALWVPLLWMLVIVSKPVAVWFQILFGVQWGEAVSLDSIVWTTLIIAGARILAKRGVTVSEIVHNNRFMSAFVLYCFVSVFWSDSVFWSFKHWIATLGHPIMALIILTEPDPKKALICLMKRGAYVAIPVSILLIRYYAEWGRSFSSWTGEAQKSGFASDKNSLGVICMIFGFFFIWHSLNTLRLERSRAKKRELFWCAAFLFMIAYLFNGLNCATALVSLAVAAMTVVLIRLPQVNKRYIGAYFVAGIAIWLVAELIFGLGDTLLGLLGKDPTLTNRTVMWSELLKFDTNPIFGAGYDSFWQGERLAVLWDRYWWKPNEAHNGYLETYLNLGLVGLFLLAGWLVTIYRKCRLDLFRELEIGLFGIGTLTMAILYNWTEAGFKTLSPVYFLCYVISVERPQMLYVSGEPPLENTESEEETEFAYAEGEPKVR
jgi:exopolysaccharide production protein ExoQ